MKQIQVTANALKTLVEEGKSLEQICEHFQDENGKSLPTATAKRYIKECGLTLKKVRRPKFVLVKDQANEVPAKVEATV